MDLQSMFSDKQAITADAASTNVIDLGAPETPLFAKAPISQDVGKGRAIPVHIQVVETFNNLTNVVVSLQVDNDVAFGSPKTVSSVTVLLADLKAGKRIPPFYIPEGVDERYVRLFYDITGTAPTTGKITAGLVFGRANWAA
jgi:hypothetical protein